MYPRNAASPERIAVGAVVQISDGAVQTTGVSIAVRPQGGASAAGLGTTAYDHGIVEYTPTQAETNYSSFVVIAYKTGCIPVSQTIVTSASATAGYAGVDWGKVTNPTTTVGLSGTTISTSQAVASVSGSVGSISGVTFPSNFGDLAITLTTGTVTVGANNDKTGYSISGTKTTLDALNDIAATDIVSGGAINTTAGAVDSVTLVATTTTNTDMVAAAPTAAAVAGAVWDEIVNVHTIADSAGQYLTLGFADVNTITGADGVTLATAQALYAPAKAGDAMTLTAAYDSAKTAASAADILTTALTESYAANGTAFTLTQGIHAIHQMLMDFSIAGTALTVKKLDNATTAFTVTLDDATTPTGASRA